MQKTGLKTFVYSFSVSLFAIFAANGVYLHSQKQEPQVKIPSKNITLFLKSSSSFSSSSAAPVRKIALSVLPDIKDNIDDDKIIMADADIPLIPLEEDIALPSVAEEVAPIFDTPSPKSQKTIVLAKTQEHTPKTEKILTPPSFEPEKITIPLEVPKSTLAIHKITKKEKQPLPKTQKNAPSSIVVANAPTPLLPLEKQPSLTHSPDTDVKIGDTTKLNHIALSDKNVPLSSMGNNIEKNTSNISTDRQRKWKTMAEKQPQSGSPWVVAKANGVLKNQKLAEAQELAKSIDIQHSNNNGVKVATNTVQNLLIPIPENILAEKDLIPQLSVDPNKEKTDAVISEKEQELFKSAEKNPKAVEKNKLLSSISSIFDKSTTNKNTNSLSKPDILKSIKKKLNNKTAKGKILPIEMRLSFQPNRAEISGQTLRWVQAFATNVAKNNSSQLEIRIDGTSTTALQQKRLNLLYNILNSKGVEEYKINTVFTQREPNSFIIRIIPLEKNSLELSQNNPASLRYKQW